MYIVNVARSSVSFCFFFHTFRYQQVTCVPPMPMYTYIYYSPADNLIHTYINISNEKNPNRFVHFFAIFATKAMRPYANFGTLEMRYVDLTLQSIL